MTIARRLCKEKGRRGGGGGERGGGDGSVRMVSGQAQRSDNFGTLPLILGGTYYGMFDDSWKPPVVRVRMSVSTETAANLGK